MLIQGFSLSEYKTTDVVLSIQDEVTVCVYKNKNVTTAEIIFP